MTERGREENKEKEQGRSRRDEYKERAERKEKRKKVTEGGGYEEGRKPERKQFLVKRIKIWF